MDAPSPAPNPAPLAPPAEPRWRVYACFLLVLAAIQIAIGPKVQLSQWHITASQNAGIAEGEAWLQGRLDIPHEGRDPARDRMHDTAYFNGKVYNVFPPLVGFLHVLLAPLHRLLLGQTDTWLGSVYVALVFLPLPILGFAVFRRQTADSAWAALLTLAWLGGTALLPNLRFARGGELGQLNHVLSQIGLLLLAADLLGRQRIWPALIGLAIAAWTRQTTFLYALPLLWIARTRGRLATGLIGVALIAAPLFTLNHLKFGTPLDFGYRYMYENRGPDDEMASRARLHGVFSPRWIPDNLHYMNAALPAVQVDLTGLRIFPSQMGASMWLTTPLLLAVLLAARTWWRDPRRRLLILSTLPVIASLLCYHSPGYQQSGYYRFALDFIPIWLAVIAPWTCGGWRTWFTFACAAWSLLYFQTVVPNV